MSIMDKLLFGALVSAESALWECCLWSQLWGCSEHLNLLWGLLEGALMHSKVSHCLCLAQGHLV